MHAFTPLFTEINDIKRITAAGRPGTIATRMFREAWAALAAGADEADLAWRFTARAVVAARLADIDRAILSDAHLRQNEIDTILRDAIDAAGEALPDELRSELRGAICAPDTVPGPVPAFVAELEQQPRAGVTCPGKPRIVLEPPENHAEHCLVVAVYGVLLAPVFAAEPGTVFLAALAHHLHNAGLPDAGFTGESLLGTHLDPVLRHFTDRALAQLEPALRAKVEAARAILPDADTPNGRAFHAADSIDRVLQIEQYMRAGSLTRGRVLGDMELVHAGPVKAFQDDILRQAGLA